jgi:transposase InsO family protein
MHQKGLQARPRKGWRPRTTNSKHPHPIAPNLLLDREKPKAVNEVCVDDITYLRTADGWLYLAGVLDLYSRKIIGRSMQQSLETSLPLAALEMALKQRGQPQKVIHHSDRGCQYASRGISRRAGGPRFDPEHESQRQLLRQCFDGVILEQFESGTAGRKIGPFTERRGQASGIRIHRILL